MAQKVINCNDLVNQLNELTPCIRDEDFRWMKDHINRTFNLAKHYFVFEEVLLIKDAILMSGNMHKMKYRDDDTTPYLLHLIYVVHMLLVLGIKDIHTIIAAILHDDVELWKNEENALEKMKEHLQEIRRTFGKIVQKVVDYLTKRPNEKKDKDSYWIRMLLMPDNQILWRVLVIKFADRIHNIRTLKGMSSVEAQARKVRETLKWFPLIKARLSKALDFLWKNLIIEDRFYLRLPDKLDNLLQAALEPHLHLAKLHPV